MKADQLIFPKSSSTWALYGTTCEAVKIWVDRFQSMKLSPAVYVDADHQDEKLELTATLSSAGIKHQIATHRLPFSDCYWVNGNHFSASQQIIIDDPSKLSSLERRREQLTNVVLVLASNGFPNYLYDWGVDLTQAMCIAPDDEEGLRNWVVSQTRQPELHALILVGGKSERMGTPKMDLSYHGMPQWKYLEEICLQMGIPVFFSCREEQKDLFISTGRKVVLDRFGNIGPLGAIASAMSEHAHTSWLALACDMPGMNAEGLHHLMSHRNIQSMATAFWNNEKQWHEPLAAIWESHAKGEVFSWLAQSQCPRKLLGVLNTKSIRDADALWYQNINTPEEKSQWIKHPGE
jgi:molybdopterin-guanine dinucleotide biosynthesis protein A